MSGGYYLLLVLAILIVTPGLLINNVAVIIGGMILAPLMIPLLSLALSLVTGNAHGCIFALRTLLISIILTLATSALLTLILARVYDVVSWIPESISPPIYLLIAFCSGTAAAFAWVKKNLAPSIAGVAVTVSLLPPLCAAGIAIALQQPILLHNSLLLFGYNIFGITFAAFLVFWLLGFLQEGKAEEKVIEEATVETH